MADYQNPSTVETRPSMTIWRPSLRRSGRTTQPHPGRHADVEMAIALILMGGMIVMTAVVVPLVGR